MYSLVRCVLIAVVITSLDNETPKVAAQDAEEDNETPKVAAQDAEEGFNCYDAGQECFHNGKPGCRGTGLYTGTKNHTVSGITCQEWAKQTPHSHKPWRAGPVNYCRNPDGEPGPWCYTTSASVRWELCFETCTHNQTSKDAAPDAEEPYCDELPSTTEGTTEAPQMCPDGWLHLTPFCYKYLTRKLLNYTDAKKSCPVENSNAHLPYFKEEQHWLDAFRNRRRIGHPGSYWLGLTDLAVEGTFVWDDGTPISGTYGSGYQKYPWTNVDPDTLNSWGIWNASDCVRAEVTVSYKWRDDGCDRKRGWYVVCQMDEVEPTTAAPTTVACKTRPPPTTTVLPDCIDSNAATTTDEPHKLCPDGWVHYTPFCYKYTGMIVNYTVGKSVCEAQDPPAHLPYFKEKKHWDDVFNNRGPIGYPGSFWIGLNDLVTEGTFFWDDGVAIAGTYGAQYQQLPWTNVDPDTLNSWGIWNSSDCVRAEVTVNFQWRDDGCDKSPGWYLVCQLEEIQPKPKEPLPLCTTTPAVTTVATPAPTDPPKPPVDGTVSVPVCTCTCSSPIFEISGTSSRTIEALIIKEIDYIIRQFMSMLRITREDILSVYITSDSEFQVVFRNTKVFKKFQRRYKGLIIRSLQRKWSKITKLISTRVFIHKSSLNVREQVLGREISITSSSRISTVQAGELSAVCGGSSGNFKKTDKESRNIQQQLSSLLKVSSSDIRSVDVISGNSFRVIGRSNAINTLKTKISKGQCKIRSLRRKEIKIKRISIEKSVSVKQTSTKSYKLRAGESKAKCGMKGGNFKETRKEANNVRRQLAKLLKISLSWFRKVEITSKRSFRVIGRTEAIKVLQKQIKAGRVYVRSLESRKSVKVTKIKIEKTVEIKRGKKVTKTKVVKKGKRVTKTKVVKKGKAKAEGKGLGVPGCFCGDAKVNTKSGVKLMKELEIGDEVMTEIKSGTVAWQPVSWWLHREPEMPLQFVVITLSDNRSIALSERHLIPMLDNCDQRSVNAIQPLTMNAKYADRAKPGMCVVQLVQGQLAFVTIERVHRERRFGYFAPITASGTIFVDDILASCYSDGVESHSLHHSVMTSIGRISSLWSHYRYTSGRYRNNTIDVPFYLKLFYNLVDYIIPMSNAM